MPGTKKEQAKIAEVIATFPVAFELRAYPGRTFRISPDNSYFTGPGECGGMMMLYTQRRTQEDVEWIDFAKGTESELRRQIVRAVPFWPDRCQHDRRPRDRFLGTVLYKDSIFDVYVYQNNALDAEPDFHICMRYGVGDSQYISPGNVENFVRMLKEKQWAPHNPPKYEAVLPLIEGWIAEAKVAR